MEYQHLKDMIKRGKLVILKTSIWDDPYENFFFKSKFEHQTIELHEEKIAQNIFGQCCTFFKDSDALWRIYSPKQESVRIRTTPRKLFDTIYINDNCMATTYIGKVNYKYKYEISNWLKKQNPIDFNDINRISTESFFIKRNNFSHEKELRIIYNPGITSPDIKSPTKEYNINVLDFIENITFDPRVRDKFYNDSRNELISDLSIPARIIKKSPIYQFKPIKVIIKRSDQ